MRDIKLLTFWINLKTDCVFETFLLDEGLRLACGLTLQAMSRYSPDVMKRHTAKALPAVFFAMHEKKTGSDRGLITPFITRVYGLDIPRNSQKRLLLMLVASPYIYIMIWLLYSQLAAAQVLTSLCGRKFGWRIHQVNSVRDLWFTRVCTEIEFSLVKWFPSVSWDRRKNWNHIYHKLTGAAQGWIIVMSELDASLWSFRQDFRKCSKH